MKTTFIYILWDPRNNNKCYIGKSNDPQKRFKNGHKLEKGKYYKVHWIQSLLKQDLEPILEILDEVSQNNWQFWERHYISLYKSWGFELVNATDGGEGFSSPWNKGLTRKSDERVNKTAQLKEGKQLSEETKKKKSLALLGRNHTKEHKRNQSLGQIKRHEKTTQIVKTLIANKTWKTRRKNGTDKVLEETKKQIAMTLRSKPRKPKSEKVKKDPRKPKSEEHKKNISLGKKNKPWTEARRLAQTNRKKK